MRLIDADVLIKRASALEMEALDLLVNYNPKESLIRWHLWNAKLNERTMFKYELIDAPTIEAIPVNWIEKYSETDDAEGSIFRMIEDWMKENADDPD